LNLKKESISSASAHTAAWIDSRDNPMLAAPEPLPNDIRRTWRRMSQAERDRVAEQYRQHGWKLIYTDTSWGGITFEWDNPLRKAHDSLVRAERGAFTAALSTEQKILWDKISGPPPVRPGTTSVTQKERVAIEQRSEDTERLANSLPPNQVQTLQRLTSYSIGQ
jgi:hypothetical protein